MTWRFDYESLFLYTSHSPEVGANSILEPGESFTTEFVVGLQHRSQFTFLVNLWGETGP